MKVLLLTAMWPTSENPAFGSFVRAQAEALRRAGVDVEVGVLEGRHRKLIYPRGIWLLQKWLHGKHFDLVHAHYGYVGFVARMQREVPVVVTYHGDDVLGTRNARGAIAFVSRLTARCCRALGYCVDAVIVQTHEMAQRFTSGNVHVVPHEVDLGLFKPLARDVARQQLGLCLSRKYLLFAANPNIPVKCFPLAAAAVEELRLGFPDCELVVVYRETQQRLAMYMSACDALVFPSCQEGSPNIVKQAMACNLPVVATNVGDVRDVIANTRHCHVSEPRPEDFARALTEVLRAGERSDGRKHVQHLDGPNVARRLIKIYEGVLTRRVTALGAISGKAA